MAVRFFSKGGARKKRGWPGFLGGGGGGGKKGLLGAKPTGPAPTALKGGSFGGGFHFRYRFI